MPSASRARLRAQMLVGLPASMAARQADVAVQVADGVVGLGENHPVMAGPAVQERRHGAHASVGVAGARDLVLEVVVEPDVPLAVEVHAVVEGIVLRDADLARIGRLHFLVDLPQQRLAVGVVIGAVVVVDDVEDGIPAEPVHPAFVQPHEDLVADELADRIGVVIRPRVAPPRVGAGVVVVEVDPAEAVLAPPVELPQVEVRRAVMVVHDVHQHGHPALVARLHETLEGVRPAQRAFDSELIGRIVSPAFVRPGIRTAA